MAFGKKIKTFETITAPLSGIASELTLYVDEKEKEIDDLTENKRKIDAAISEAKSEINKSTVTSKNMILFMDPDRVIMTKGAKDVNEEAEDVAK